MLRLYRRRFCWDITGCGGHGCWFCRSVRERATKLSASTRTGASAGLAYGGLCNWEVWFSARRCHQPPLSPMPIAEPRFSWSGAGVWEGGKAASLCRGRSHVPRDGGGASRDRARKRWDGGCARRDWSHLAEPRGCAWRGRSHSAEPGGCAPRGRSHSAEPGSCGRRGRSHLPEPGSCGRRVRSRLPEPPDSGRQPRARKREERGGKMRLPACFPRPSVCAARRRSRLLPPSAPPRLRGKRNRAESPRRGDFTQTENHNTLRGNTTP